MQFNSLSRAKITPHQFKHLDTLDLSYNQVSCSSHYFLLPKFSKYFKANLTIEPAGVTHYDTEHRADREAEGADTDS